MRATRLERISNQYGIQTPSPALWESSLAGTPPAHFTSWYCRLASMVIYQANNAYVFFWPYGKIKSSDGSHQLIEHGTLTDFLPRFCWFFDFSLFLVAEGIVGCDLSRWHGPFRCVTIQFLC
jgi:hypothetical protein